MEQVQYAIITENDTSAWHDETGSLYHYPKRYLSLLKPGTRIIYYKEGMKINNNMRIKS